MSGTTQTCHAISKLVTDTWCNNNCNNPGASFCPAEFCACVDSGSAHTTVTPAVHKTTVTPAVQRVNCEFTWGEWSPCSKPCGGEGQQNRSPKISQQAQNGGNACPSPQTRACNTAPCPCMGYCAAPGASSPHTTEYPAACYPRCATETT